MAGGNISSRLCPISDSTKWVAVGSVDYVSGEQQTLGLARHRLSYAWVRAEQDCQCQCKDESAPVVEIFLCA